MRAWKVIVTDDVQNDLDNFTYYLIAEKLSPQAAIAVLRGYDETIDELATVAGLLKTLEDPAISDYRAIRLRRHNYYLIYRIVNDSAIVDKMYHDLQDIDKVIKK